LNAGFRSIDSLEKRFATGFMLPNNGLVVDLHTAISVAGLSYFPSRLVLRNTRLERVHTDGREVGVRVAANWVNSFVMALHSMIKEGTMRFQEAFDITADFASEEIGLRSSQTSFAGVKDPLLAGLRVA